MAKREAAGALTFHKYPRGSNKILLVLANNLYVGNVLEKNREYWSRMMKGEENVRNRR